MLIGLSSLHLMLERLDFRTDSSYTRQSLISSAENEKDETHHLSISRPEERSLTYRRAGSEIDGFLVPRFPSFETNIFLEIFFFWLCIHSRGFAPVTGLDNGILGSALSCSTSGEHSNRESSPTRARLLKLV